MGALIRRLRRRDEGSELIEFALVTPLFLLLFVGVIDFGFLFMRLQVITNAAREGARVGILQGYKAADVSVRVGDYVRAGGLAKAPTTTVTTVALPNGGTGVRVQVAYPHTFTFLGPIGALFGSNFGSITLRAAATMKVEI